MRFFKAQASSLAATLVDFSMTVILKEWLHCARMLAIVLGTVSGGIVNFTMNRRWVFGASDKDMQLQARRYLLVWLGNLGLVSGGSYLLIHYSSLGYLGSKVLVSLAVGIFYNYTLQKRFVFK